MRRLLAAALIACAAPAFAQTSDLVGDWDGLVTIRAGLTLPIILHLADSGATMESPEQGNRIVPLTTERAGNALTAAMPAGRGVFTLDIAADGKALDGTLLQGGMSLPVHLARRPSGAAAPAADRPQTPKPPFPYRSEEVRFPARDGTLLAGTITRPDSVASLPAVVLIAGSGQQTRDEAVLGHKPFLLLADRLTRAGFVVFRYDKRGVGASGGTYATATQDDFTADAAAALAWLHRQPGVDSAHVGLIGHSEGAEIAPEVARGPGVAFLILLAPPGLDGGALILSQQRAIQVAMGVPADRIEASQQTERDLLAIVRAGSDGPAIRTKAVALLESKGVPATQAGTMAEEAATDQMRVFLAHDPIPALKALRQPVLVVQGGRDLQVVPADNLPPIRAALAGHPNARIVELDGLNHLLQPARTGAPSEYRDITTTIDEQALTLIVDWAKVRAAQQEKP